nr:hypothetical protein [Halorussus amylolyticus]
MSSWIPPRIRRHDGLTTHPAPHSAVLIASTLAPLLAVIATGVGLFVPGFYRDAEVLLPQLYGQDLLTLVVAVPPLAVAVVGFGAVLNTYFGLQRFEPITIPGGT